MRKVFLSGMLVVLWAAQAQAGQRASGSSVQVWQGGAVVSQVAAGSEFSIRGTGFRSGLPVWVCIFGDVCALSEVDTSGAFAQDRSLANRGTFGITVSQARNSQLSSWLQKAATQITVIN